MKTGDLVILGSRGSYPTPRPEHQRYGGNTTALALFLKDSLLLFDAGTGIIPLGYRLAADESAPREIHLFFSHFHHDHICGLFPFVPFRDERFRVRIHLTADRLEHGRSVISSMFGNPVWPVEWESLGGDITFHELPESFEREGFVVRHHPLPHPGGSRAYRIEGPGRVAVFATDYEPAGVHNPKLVEFCRGAHDVLYDSHFSPEEYDVHRGWGHSTWKAGVELVGRTGEGRLVMIHHNPERDDEGIDGLLREARAAYGNVEAAREGLVIPLS